MKMVKLIALSLILPIFSILANEEYCANYQEHKTKDMQDAEVASAFIWATKNLDEATFFSCAKLMKSRGISFNARTNATKYTTALNWAASHEKDKGIKFVEYLIANGALKEYKYPKQIHYSLDFCLAPIGSEKDTWGNREQPIINATYSGSYAIVQLLLKHGADVNVTDNSKKTA